MKTDARSNPWIETMWKINDCINASVRAVKAWDGRKDWEVETYWLDDENFVINWTPTTFEMQNDDGAEYACPMLRELGNIVAEILNDYNGRFGRRRGEWACYDSLTWWRDHEELQENDDGEWDTIQCSVRWEPETEKQN